MDEGVLEGESDGKDDGAALNEGIVEGALEGKMDGKYDGLILNEGTEEGIKLGFIVEVGPFEGETDDNSVGAWLSST